jgi:hypothetical protein
MDSKSLKFLLMERAEQMVPAAEIDLWTAIQARLAARHSVLQGSGGVLKKRTFSRPLTLLVPIALALILAMLLVTATPQGQTLAQEFLSLFSHTQTDRIPMPTDAGPAAITPVASISKGEALTGWHVLQPAWLPQGFAFDHIDYRPGSESVVQEYRYQPAIGMQAGYFYLGQRKAPFNDLWPVSASAQIETVQIGDVSGEYGIGAWGGDADHQIWETNPNFQHLRWQANGCYFDIDFSVFGVDPADLANSPYYISKEKLVEIAKSMK